MNWIEHSWIELQILQNKGICVEIGVNFMNINSYQGNGHDKAGLKKNRIGLTSRGKSNK